MAALRAAKAALDLPFLITLCPAVPGGPARVLALRQPPPFLCDYAPIADPDNPAAVRAAMEWALDDTRDDSRASLVLDQLVAIFGMGVREIPWEKKQEEDRWL